MIYFKPTMDKNSPPLFKYIDSDLDDVRYVYHISDIHIRKRIRHDEYMTVFKRFCQLVEKHISSEGKNCIIVVTGDIMHDKSEMVPESVDLLRRFLLVLSDLTEVVLIIGNHDVNIFNRTSLDCLTPIVSDLRTIHKVHLLDDNKIYVYGDHNILFGVTTLWADTVTEISSDIVLQICKQVKKKYHYSTLTKDATKIGLYHGMIHGCTLDNGTKANFKDTNSTCFNQTDFDGYDIVMLGDIHKHQFLNKKGTIAYAGSLIQQKRDEDLLEHGAILWDLVKKKAEFIRIRNDFGMIQIVVGSSKKDIKKLQQKLTDRYNNVDLPKNLDVKMIYSSIEGKNSFKKMYESIIEKHNIVKITEITDTSDLHGIPVDLTNIVESYNSTDSKYIDKDAKPEENQSTKIIKKVNPIKLTDNDAVLKIMIDHLTNKEILIDGGLTVTSIKKEINDILKTIDYNFEQEIKNVKLKSIQFDNMFVYVEGNGVDFEKFNNIVGLNASNYQGKSSFIDIILYSIYGECSRGKRFDVLNIKKQNMNSRISLDVNGREYIIVRTSCVNTTSKRDLKESVSLWEDGENITSDDRVKTHQLICKKICTYDDMLNNSFVLQKNGKSFVDLTDREKKDLLCKMARLDIFDNIFVEAKSRHSSYSQLVGRLTKKIEQYDDMIELTKSSKRSRGTNINGKMAMIEKSFRSKIEKIDVVIKKLESHIERQEYILTTATDKYHQLNLKLSVHDTVGEMYKDYETDKASLQLMYEDLILDMNESMKVRADMQTLLNGRSIDSLKKEKETAIRETEHTSRCIRDTIESTLRKIISIDKRFEYVSSISTAREKLLERANIIDEENTHILAELDLIKSYEDSLVDIQKTYERFVELNNKAAECMRIDKQFKILSKKLKQQIKDMENHEYNLDCDKCMKNPVTKALLETKNQLINNEQELESNGIEYRTVTLELESLPKDIEQRYHIIVDKIKSKQNLEMKRKMLVIEDDKIQSELRMLHDITEARKNNALYEDRIKDLKEKLKQTEVPTVYDYDRYLKILNIYETINKRVMSNINKIKIVTEKLNRMTSSYDRYVIDTIEVSSNIKHREQLKSYIDSAKEKIRVDKGKLTSLTSDKIKLELEFENFLEVKSEIDKAEKMKLITGYIKKILDKNGLVDTLLSKNIIPYLQRNINSILADVGHYQVNIEYKNQSVNIYKDSGLNIIMSSGYESYLLDLVFRLALVQINNHIKTDFLLIDEGFNACDSDNKNNIKELLEHMRSYYRWILIISHDEFIKSFYDMDIRITPVDGGSRLCNMDKKIEYIESDVSEPTSESSQDPIDLYVKVRKKIEKKLLV